MKIILNGAQRIKQEDPAVKFYYMRGQDTKANGEGDRKQRYSVKLKYIFR